MHRGAHPLAGEATEAFESARDRLAAFLGAQSNEIVWTSNATEAINLRAYAFSTASSGRGGAEADRFRLRAGDEIVVTELERHANLIAWQELAARTGATLRYIGVDDNGHLLLRQARDVIGERTRVLAFAHVSIVLGGVNSVTDLVALARNVGALQWSQTARTSRYRCALRSRRTAGRDAAVPHRRLHEYERDDGAC